MVKIFLKITLIVLILSSCSKNENRTIIRGLIPELASKTIQLNFIDFAFSKNVDSSGNFRLDIFLEKPQYFYFNGLNKNIFLLPNDSLLIEKKNNEFIYSGGQSALINNYYTDLENYLNAVSDTADFEAYYNQQPYEFLKSVDNWIEVFKQPLYKLQKNYPDINEDFVNLESDRIKYKIYSDLNDYENKNQEIPDDFYQYLNKVNLNNKDLMQFGEYKYFLRSYIFMQARRLNIKEKIHETSKMLDIIQKTFQYELILNEISKEVIRIQTNRLNINDTLINRFKTICSNTEYVKEIEGNYQNFKSLLKGGIAPDFELIGLKGEKITLKDFKGKYLLIDVWSTTCSLCIREMPIIEELKQELKDKNIEIIAACISGETAWKKTLSKYGLKEGQYRIENGWESEFRWDYLKSSGTPVYILIGSNGRIIDARASRPSENLRDLINKLDI